MTIKDIETIIKQIAEKYGYQIMAYNCDGGQSSIMCRAISENQYEIRLRTAEKDKYDVIKREIGEYLLPFNFYISDVKFDDKIGPIMIRCFIVEQVKIPENAVPYNLYNEPPNVTNNTYNINKVSKSQLAFPNSIQENRNETNIHIETSIEKKDNPCLFAKIIKFLKK